MANIANTVIIDPNQDPTLQLGANSLAELIANGNVATVYQSKDNTYINVVDVKATSQYVTATTNYPAGNTGDIQFKYGVDFGASPALTYDIGNATLRAPIIQSNFFNAGNLTASNLVVSNLADLGNVSNLRIGGGLNNQVLTVIDDQANVVGWTYIAGAGGIVGGNVSNIKVNANTVAISVANTANVFVVTANGANLAGNLAVSNNISALDVTVRDITSNGNVTFTGPVSISNIANFHIAGGSNGQYLQTDGNGNIIFANAAGFPDRIVSGNSNLVLTPNANATFSIAGNANVLVVTGTGANITGTANVTGNTNLGNLAVAGNTSLGNVGNVSITGGSNAQYLQTDGTGNLNWANLPIPNGIYNGNSNVVVAANGVVSVAVTGIANVAVFDVNRVRIGANAGSNSQSNGAIAIGANAASNTQSNNAVAIGQLAGNNTQGLSAVAIGNSAGLANQSTRSIAIGDSAGGNGQGTLGVAIGYQAGANSQSTDGIAVGFNSGQTTQGANGVAIGRTAGQTTQGANAIALGLQAGSNAQSGGAIAIGANAGANVQGANSISIGQFAGNTGQGSNSVAVGNSAGQTRQGINAVAVGANAGSSIQANGAVAVGYLAGNSSQGINAVAVGPNSASRNQGTQSVSVGYNSGADSQGANSVSVGPFSGALNQSNGAIAIGLNAGANAQGVDAIAIGTNAGANGQVDNSIVINATGNILNGNTNSGLYVAPIRSDVPGSNVLYYDVTTNEITSGSPPAVGSVSSVANVNSSISIPVASGNIRITAAGNALGNFTGSGLVISGLSTTSTQVTLGNNAGVTGQGANAIAIGANAATTTQGAGAISVGANTGATQGANAIAIGTNAGATGQGANSIAIGLNAGQSSQPANSIVINATGVVINGATTDSLFVAPIRAASANSVLYYDSTTNEITYSDISAGAKISNGTSNVNIGTSGGPVTVGIAGNTVMTVTAGGASLTGAFTATGNITTTGNATVSGNFVANGSANVGANLFVGGAYANFNGNTYTTGNANVSGYITSLGNVTGSNVIASNNVTATANITGGNLVTSGNVSGGNLSITGVANIGGNINALANIAVSGDVDAVGNLIGSTVQTVADAIIGGNANVTGNISGNNLSISNNASITGNISANNATIATKTTTANLTANGTVNFTTSPNISFSSIGNFHIPGGNANYVIATDGNGVLSWYNPTGGISNGSSSVTIPNADGNIDMTAGGNLLITVGSTAATVYGNLTISGPTGSYVNMSVPDVFANGATVYANYVEVTYDVWAKANLAVGANTFIVYANGNATANYITSNGANLGNVTKLTITGGSANQFLKTDGTGVLAWSNVIGNLSNGTSVTFNPSSDITILGTTNQINSNLSGSTFTIGFPDKVKINTSLGVGGPPPATAGEITAAGAITAGNYFIGAFGYISNGAGGQAGITGLGSGTTFLTIAGNTNQIVSTVSGGRANLTLDPNVQIVTSLGVGTAGSGTTGEIRATNNITAYYSDDRLKTKLGPITDALAKVRKLAGFYYEANELAQSLGYTVKREVGLSAQQMQEVMPEIVTGAPIDPEKYLTIWYERSIPLLVEAIKELDDQVQALRRGE